MKSELSGDSAADLLSMSSKLDGLRELVERLRRELTACQHENIELHEIIDLLRSEVCVVWFSCLCGINIGAQSRLFL